jgi:hypothetical protein
VSMDLTTLRLGKGAHHDRADGMDLLEAVAWFASEPHTDRPECVSPVLGVFGRQLNDALNDDKRQQLISLIERLPGTAGDGLDETRGYLALDWLIRVCTPTWVEAAGLVDAEMYLRELPPVVDLHSATAAGEKVRRVRGAAWIAAKSADGDAAWSAARATAGAAREASWATAAYASVGETAWQATWYAARAAAGDALAPIVDQLQDSAITLYTRMITPTNN